MESAEGVRGGREWEWGEIEQGWDPGRRAKSLAFLGRDEEGEEGKEGEKEEEEENDENDENENEVENETEEPVITESETANWKS